MIRWKTTTDRADRRAGRSWKIAALASAAVLVTAMSGCATSSDGAGSGGDGDVVVGYSGYTLSNPYFTGLIKGLEKGATSHGFKLLQTNSNGDNNTQVNDIQNLITKGAKYIVISPADASAIVPAVKAAKAAGATVIAISDTIKSDDVQFTVAMNHVTIGEQSAQGIVDFLTKKNGSPSGKILDIQGIAGSSAATDREKGFNNIISKYPDIDVVARQDGGFDTDKTYRVMTDLLQAHKGVEAVFTSNDSEAQGATKAIEAAGLLTKVGEPGHIFVTGNDAPAPAIADIRAGRQDMTVSSNPIKLSELVMDKIAEIEAGKDVSGFIEWPGMIITPANIDSAEVKDYGIWADQVG
ncbi:sugar ABC transporter substrate-binding protein [Aeromicrobium endophyticum]|uniref:D-ribose ABC transporter substrate-binding protein n=1 Tax=Aeromicrobium endophyticum TaxID=2292704 RepID=A0A371P4Z3_9ACTN|nr:sugar ABC transporter substrate-binding protein [Aeromicrobium endophyticum]REK70925.1 D-ribose ABC transporter substrate-binding protein [Aeromicrobium endophyticum]